MGNFHKALDHYQLALKLRRAQGDREKEAATNIRLSQAHDGLGEHQRALQLLENVLQYALAAKKSDYQSSALVGIGTIHLTLGKDEKALEYFREALPLVRAAQHRKTESLVLMHMGTVYYKLAKYEQALEHINQAYALVKDLNDPQARASLLYLRAGIKHNLNRNLAALKDIEEAIALVEAVRDKITDNELRISFTAAIQSYYCFYIGLLQVLDDYNMDGNYATKALQMTESIHARVLLEMLAEARVVASLWKIDDAATAEFMRLFYQGMFGSAQLSPAAALRQAQLEMSKTKRWQSPFYWAAFVLQGEWR